MFADTTTRTRQRPYPDAERDITPTRALSHGFRLGYSGRKRKASNSFFRKNTQTLALTFRHTHTHTHTRARAQKHKTKKKKKTEKSKSLTGSEWNYPPPHQLPSTLNKNKKINNKTKPKPKPKLTNSFLPLRTVPASQTRFLQSSSSSPMQGRHSYPCFPAPTSTLHFNLHRNTTQHSVSFNFDFDFDNDTDVAFDFHF